MFTQVTGYGDGCNRLRMLLHERTPSGLFTAHMVETAYAGPHGIPVRASPSRDNHGCSLSTLDRRSRGCGPFRCVHAKADVPP